MGTMRQDEIDMVEAYEKEIAALKAKNAKLLAGYEAIGPWMSAAIDDPKVCAEMKRDIETFFKGFEPV